MVDAIVLIAVVVVCIITISTIYFKYVPRFKLRVKDKNSISLTVGEFDTLVHLTLRKLTDSTDKEVVESFDMIGKLYEVRDNHFVNLTEDDLIYILEYAPKNRTKVNDINYKVVIHKLKYSLSEG